MPFDPNKPVQTRDGKPARILCTDRRSSVGLSIVALVDHGDVDVLTAYTLDGRISNDMRSISRDDLVNVPEVITHHINIIREETDGLIRYMGPYETAAGADAGWESARRHNGASITRVAVIRLRFHEGDGLVSPLSSGDARTASVKE